MNATQSVVFGTLVSFIIFMLSGNDGRTRVTNGIRSAQGKPPVTLDPASDRIVTTQVMVGWAVLFIMLIAAADVPATAPLAAGFAWLLVISTFIMFGTAGFENLTKILGTSSTTSAGGHGGGGTF